MACETSLTHQEFLRLIFGDKRSVASWWTVSQNLSQGLPFQPPVHSNHNNNRRLYLRLGASEPPLVSMEAERIQWKKAVFSKSVIDTALAAVQPQSRQVYDLRWAKFVDWCKQRKLKPVSVSVPPILTFLNRMAKSGKALNTVKGYLTAISKRHERVKVGKKLFNISQLPSVQQWRKGLEVKFPTRPKIVPEWNLEVVLTSSLFQQRFASCRSEAPHTTYCFLGGPSFS